MVQLGVKNYIKIPSDEYARLKKLAQFFDSFWGYIQHLRDIQEAREEVRGGKTIKQEELFRKFGA